MALSRAARFLFLLMTTATLLAVGPARPQAGDDAKRLQQSPLLPSPEAKLQVQQPRLVPLAETRVLMDGINWPNFIALEQGLKRPPRDDHSWLALRDHALLIAENGNLLLLRSPGKKSEAWTDRAVALRTVAARLADAAAERNAGRSRQVLLELARTCDRCHDTFQTGVQIVRWTQQQGDTQSAAPAAPSVPPPPRVPAPPAVPQPATPPIPPS
jgi:hypothetical protein